MDVTLVKTWRGGSSGGSAPTPTPHLFLILESRRVQALPARYSLSDVDEVILGRGKTRAIYREVVGGMRRLVVRIPDPWMSSMHARIERRYTALYTVIDTRSTNGTLVNGGVVESRALRDGDVIELGQTFFLFRAEVPTSDLDARDLEAIQMGGPEGLRSLIPPLAYRFFQLTQIVKTSMSVVLLGATGTGKEVVARAVHDLSGRPGDFVPVNCGALPESLVENQFFGHRRGAFTGATEDRAGLVAAAHHGTLFLDEIGDLPLTSQAALLRVLQEREVTPVGATKPISVDFRLVCATHRNMEDLVERGIFREDLYARLSGFMVELPPLRERKEDMGMLVAHVLRRLSAGREEPVMFHNKAVRALLAYHWPRNIRELYTCLEPALALADRGLIELEHLSEPVRRAFVIARPPDSKPNEPMIPLTEEALNRRATLIALLREHGGNVSAVARTMGKARSQVQRWVKRYGLDPTQFRF